MFECLVIGDSIAVGTHAYLPKCESYSKGGLNSWQWNNRYLAKDLGPAETVIISLGTNDHKGVKTLKELETMRSLVVGKRVFWIMPPCNNKFCKPEVNQYVKQVAEKYGDTVIGTTRLQKDSIHPSAAGYKELAEQVK